MVLRGFLGQNQIPTDLPVAQAFGDQCQHFRLPGGQAIEPGVPRRFRQTPPGVSDCLCRRDVVAD